MAQAEDKHLERVRIAVVMLAGIQAFGALADLPAIFFDYENDTRLLIFAQTLTSVKIALAPFFTGAAFYFGLVGKVPRAIILLAALILVSWASDLPSIAIHGWELTPDMGGATSIATRFIAPAIGIAAILLAWRNERLGLATFLVALPTITYWIGVAVFAIGVAIYGF